MVSSKSTPLPSHAHLSISHPYLPITHRSFRVPFVQVARSEWAAWSQMHSPHMQPRTQDKHHNALSFMFGLE
jgi:hypothetical protein